MRIALVHDDFMQGGGAESLFATIAQLFPKSPIYTALINKKAIPASIDVARIRTSFMQKIPFITKLYKVLLPLYPLAFESFNFDNFDLVISSTTRFAKSVITKPGTIHICYINSVPRFIWDSKKQADYIPSPLRFITMPLLKWLKRWDKVTSSRVDYYLANSQNVARKVKEIYGYRPSVVFPFANTVFFKPAKIHNWKLKNQKYFLLVSRLVKWKKIEIALEACKALNKNLMIVGDGPDKNRLKNLAKSTTSPIEFAGTVSIEKLRELYQNAQGLIVTQEEDFGISTVEAQACGIPIIAFSKGGQKEIIIDKKTGILFKHQNSSSVEDAIRLSLELEWNLGEIRKNALKFSKTHFERNLKAKIKEYVHN